MIIPFQKQTTTQKCDKHGGQELQYYCNNCGLATCSDCGLLDTAHKDHQFVRLSDAAKEMRDCLKDITTKSKEVDKHYEDAIQQTQKVLQDLEKSAASKRKEFDETKAQIF